MSEGTPPTVLRIRLPGVVSWSRPRRMRGGVRYPAAYARARDAWSLLVAQAVRDARWQPPPAARYRVGVTVRGGGKRDLDRVCTAVLDALQGGNAIRDDVFVTSLTATKTPAAAGADARTEVQLEVDHTRTAKRWTTSPPTAGEAEAAGTVTYPGRAGRGKQPP
jgi:Holliday junction resolvase RusA-like endonuclease